MFFSPEGFTEYELIDAGGFEKLERFGTYILRRPEPQAVWKKTLDERDWQKLAHVVFVPKTSSSGNWNKLKTMPDRWEIKYRLNGDEDKSDSDKTLRFRLALTGFKHVGIFPEQAVNWKYIYNALRNPELKNPSFLNLFAYTGGASLAARAAGADVTHLDSIKQVVTWANDNMTLSGLDNIRWMVDDAMKFVKREIRRGKTYSGIILDPPAYGHGPNGESWKLEDHILELVNDVAQLLNPERHFLILNTYSLGFSSLIIQNLLSDVKKKDDKLSSGELFLPSKHGAKLPLGVFGILSNLLG